jgi:hypothetical protein
MVRKLPTNWCRRGFNGVLNVLLYEPEFEMGPRDNSTAVFIKQWATVQLRIFCFPGIHLKIYRLKYREI